MKVTVTGSLGNISRILIEKLVSVGHEVKLITSTAERAKEIEQLGAIPLVGKVDDLDFVNSAFRCRCSLHDGSAKLRNNRVD